MARPGSVVKNRLSLAIAELRKRLGFSQQAFAVHLRTSLNTVARWELNSRPSPYMLKRLIEVATQYKAGDLERALWREYEREYERKLYDLFGEMFPDLPEVIDLSLVDAIQAIDDGRFRDAKHELEKLRRRIKEEFPGYPAPKDERQADLGFAPKKAKDKQK